MANNDEGPPSKRTRRASLSKTSAATPNRSNPIEQKEKELAEREEQLRAREAHLAKVFHRIPEDQATPLTVVVGGREFYTSDAVLTSKDSLLAAMVNNPDAKFKGVEPGGKLIIPRDGETFHYILEYLLYGKLISRIEAPMLQKLAIEADYYCLPEEFKEQVSAMGGWVDSSASSSSSSSAALPTPPYLIKLSTNRNSVAGWWRFTHPHSVPESKEFFDFDGSNLIKINRSGVYHIVVRGCFQGVVSFALLVDTTPVAKCQMAPSKDERNWVAAELNEIRFLPAGATISVSNYTTVSAEDSEMSNNITILFVR